MTAQSQQRPADAHYRVRVTKDHLVFSAAHFITFAGNVCERLHGHNWRVAAEIAGHADFQALLKKTFHSPGKEIHP